MVDSMPTSYRHRRPAPINHRQLGGHMRRRGGADAAKLVRAGRGQAPNRRLRAAGRPVSAAWATGVRRAAQANGGLPARGGLGDARSAGQDEGQRPRARRPRSAAGQTPGRLGRSGPWRRWGPGGALGHRPHARSAGGRPGGPWPQKCGPRRWGCPHRRPEPYTVSVGKPINWPWASASAARAMVSGWWPSKTMLKTPRCPQWQPLAARWRGPPRPWWP